MYGYMYRTTSSLEALEVDLNDAVAVIERHDLGLPLHVHVLDLPVPFTTLHALPPLFIAYMYM